MKRLLAFVLLAVFVFSLTGCSAKNAKSDIFNLVENNYDEIVALNNYINPRGELLWIYILKIYFYNLENLRMMEKFGGIKINCLF